MKACRAAEAIRKRITELYEDVRLRCILFVLLLAMIGVTVFLFNVHTPLQMDDYDYAISWATGKPLSGLADVLTSQAVHYKQWGGRSVVHTLAQAFLFFGKDVFNVANTAAYIVLLLEIVSLAKGKGTARFHWLLLLAAHAFLMTCVPFFGTVFLWLDGACNYLWGTMIALWPLLIEKSRREGGVFSKSRCAQIVAVPLCFLAGWTNENTACGILAVLMLLRAADVFEKKRITWSMWGQLIAQAAGVCVMLAAPGNFARASASASYRSVIWELLRRVATISMYTLVYCGFLLILLILLWALCKALGIVHRVGWLAALLSGALLASYAMIGSPELSDRAFTGVLVLVLCAVLTLCADMDEKCRALNAAKLCVLPIALVLVVYGSYHALGDICGHETAWNAQIARIEQAKAAGEEMVMIDSVESVSRFTKSIVISEEPDVWPNTTLQKTFGIQIRER